MKKYLRVTPTIAAVLLVVGILSGCVPAASVNAPVTPTSTTQEVATSTDVAVVVDFAPTTTEPIDTSDWKTYRNSRYGFSIAIPSKWVYLDQPDPTGGPDVIHIFPLRGYSDWRTTSPSASFFLFPGGEYDRGLGEELGRDVYDINGVKFLVSKYPLLEYVTPHDPLPGEKKFFRAELHFNSTTDPVLKESLYRILHSLKFE